MRSLLVLLPLSLLLAQTPPPGWKEFSVGKATRNASRFNPREGLRAEGIPLQRAISRAYGIPEYLITGPAWIAGQRYAITALISGEPATFQPLFRKELARVFHLEAHSEKRTVPVYVLQRMDDTPHHMPESGGAPGASEMSTGTLNMSGGTVAGLAEQLSLMSNRPVIDETGIAGRFDIKLKWNPVNTASLVGAIKDQLGLKLVDTMRPMEYLVIDRVEEPVL